MTETTENLILCNNCNIEFNLSELTKIDYNYYCQECIDENFTKCSECNELTHNDNISYDSSNNDYCESCYNDNIIICQHCNESIHIDDAETTNNGDYYCTDCFNNYFTACDWCGEVYHDDDIHHNDHNQDLCESCWKNASHCENCEEWLHNDAIFSHNDCSYCEDCYNNIDKFIHEYSYKPEPIFHGNTSDFLGIEIEVDEGGKSEANAEGLLETMNFQTEDKIYIKDDGSLNDGFEIVSHPATLSQHLTIFDWENLLTECVNLGYTSHDAETCGMHIHISRDAFGNTEIEQDLNITKLLLITEIFWDNLVKFSRRNEAQLSKWAKRYGLTSDSDELLKDAKASYYKNRYRAINLQNEHTVEIRIFRGTLNYTTFASTLQFCQLLLDICRNYKIQDIQSITWEKVTTHASEYDYTELQQYLQKRGL